MTGPGHPRTRGGDHTQPSHHRGSPGAGPGHGRRPESQASPGARRHRPVPPPACQGTGDLGRQFGPGWGLRAGPPGSAGRGGPGTGVLSLVLGGARLVLLRGSADAGPPQPPASAMPACPRHRGCGRLPLSPTGLGEAPGAPPGVTAGACWVGSRLPRHSGSPVRRVPGEAAPPRAPGRASGCGWWPGPRVPHRTRCPRPPCPSLHPDVPGPGGPSRPPAASSFHAWAARGQAACDREAFNPLGNGRRSFNYLRRQRKRRSPQTLCTVGRRPGRGPALRGQAGSRAACGRPASRVTSSKAQGRRAAGPQGARCVRSFLTSPLRSPEARERAAVLPWAQRPGRAG